MHAREHSFMPAFSDHALDCQRNSTAPLNILLILLRDSYQLFDWSVPPIGPAYVSAYLKSRGCHVFTLNLNAEHGDERQIVSDCIRHNNIHLVGIGDLVTRFAQMKEMLEYIKSVHPEIIVFMGGGLVTYSPDEAMRGIPCADIGVIGEGEITAYEMVRALEEGRSLADVDGLVYRTKDAGVEKIVFSKARKPIRDLDSLPFPDWDGFKFFQQAEQHSSPDNQRIVSAPLVTSRSCPFSCTYCSKSGGQTYRQRSLDNIFAELELLVREKNVNRLFLDDELFAFNANRLYEFCERIERFHIQWLVYLRVGKHMTSDVLRKMKNSGCIRIFYGFESGDDSVLASMKKKITVRDIRDTVQRTYDAGILCTGQFIFGDVAENRTTIENTFSFAKSIQDKVIFMEYAMIRCYPGSALFAAAVRSGRIPDTLDFIRKGCPLVNMSQLSDEEYDIFVAGRLVEEKKALLLDWAQRETSLVMRAADNSAYYTVSFVCGHCLHENAVNVYPVNLAKHCKTLCVQCGESHTFVALKAYAEHIDLTLRSLLHGSGAVFWGAGAFLMLFAAVSPALEEMPWIQVDKDPGLWGKTKNGRTVFSPEEIGKKQCDTVIVSAVDQFDAIAGFVRAHFPHVRTICNLREIGFAQGGVMHTEKNHAFFARPGEEDA